MFKGPIEEQYAQAERFRDSLPEEQRNAFDRFVAWTNRVRSHDNRRHNLLVTAMNVLTAQEIGWEWHKVEWDRVEVA